MPVKPANGAYWIFVPLFAIETVPPAERGADGGDGQRFGGVRLRVIVGQHVEQIAGRVLHDGERIVVGRRRIVAGLHGHHDAGLGRPSVAVTDRVLQPFRAEEIRQRGVDEAQAALGDRDGAALVGCGGADDRQRLALIPLRAVVGEHVQAYCSCYLP